MACLTLCLSTCRRCGPAAAVFRFSVCLRMCRRCSPVVPVLGLAACLDQAQEPWVLPACTLSLPRGAKPRVGAALPYRLSWQPSCFSDGVCSSTIPQGSPTLRSVQQETYRHALAVTGERQKRRGASGWGQPCFGWLACCAGSMGQPSCSSFVCCWTEVQQHAPSVLAAACC